MCARQAGCVFLADKEVFCSQHGDQRGEREVVPERDIYLNRCVSIETHYDRPGRRIPRALEVEKAVLQIGTTVTYFSVWGSSVCLCSYVCSGYNLLVYMQPTLYCSMPIRAV